MKCGDATNPGGIGRKKNGDPCGNEAMPGTFRCYMHGGSSPAAKLKAEQSMALLRMPAIETLYLALMSLNKVMEQFQDDTCAACGYPKGDLHEKEALIKACRSSAMTASQILDRTGLGPSSSLEIKQSDGDLNLAAWTEAERAKLVEYTAGFKLLKEAVKTRLARATVLHETPSQTM